MTQQHLPWETACYVRRTSHLHASHLTLTIAVPVDGGWRETMALHLNADPTDRELLELGRAVHVAVTP